jgi:hypothetical protein
MLIILAFGDAYACVGFISMFAFRIYFGNVYFYINSTSDKVIYRKVHVIKMREDMRRDT